MACCLTSAVIPALNEAISIRRTIKYVSAFCDEIIVIDDGSVDNTSVIATNAGARVIRFEENRGYISAIKEGFQLAQGKIVVLIDADGEFPADKIPLLVSPILENKADMVQGHRDHISRISEKFLNWLANRIEWVGDSGTGFRAIRADIARGLKLDGACICGVFSLEVLNTGARLVEIPITVHSISKPRKIAWYHLEQLFCIIGWFFKIKRKNIRISRRIT